MPLYSGPAALSQAIFACQISSARVGQHSCQGKQGIYRKADLPQGSPLASTFSTYRPYREKEKRKQLVENARKRAMTCIENSNRSRRKGKKTNVDIARSRRSERQKGTRLLEWQRKDMGGKDKEMILRRCPKTGLKFGPPLALVRKEMVRGQREMNRDEDTKRRKKFGTRGEKQQQTKRNQLEEIKPRNGQKRFPPQELNTRSAIGVGQKGDGRICDPPWALAALEYLIPFREWRRETEDTKTQGSESRIRKLPSASERSNARKERSSNSDAMGAGGQNTTYARRKQKPYSIRHRRWPARGNEAM
ncbi:hypothetical protein K504DRAFT_454653 [Pleomassaria siparia CBS 279.74]|uniref:Uncharacterized protein n=1 Tax=Pleomassaria siparia CBS 279.74 TaxID=1314801 RepID=A0A6G1KBS1_9PLEO|nr:hypothetical protein K504DRAFT_454653 [Pleomassaria siparia CBS 279.74]